MIDPHRLRQALEEARQELDEAAAVAGRRPGEVEIVLAGKYVEPAEAPALVQAGVRVVGENRMQDLLAKFERIGREVAYDFIGHLQRRKVRTVLPLVRLVHSVDSVGLAEEIARRADGPTRVLVQVNVAGEDTKGGIPAAGLRAFVEEVSRHEGIVIGGLMGMPPFTDDPERSRPWFSALRALRDEVAAEWAGRHDFRDLSMGTSQDFRVAAQEGATIVRIGRGVIERSRME